MLEEELRSAAARGNVELVKELLKQGAIFSPDSCGRTPLHLSSAAGNSEIVKLLLNQNNINAVDAVGRTPLQIASSCGHVEVVDVLLKNGANVNSRDIQNGNTALHEACWHGLSQTVRLLAKANCELDVTNSGGFASIHLACQNGHNQCCRELLLAGTNPDAQNNYGDTALHTSARYGHAGVARILLSAGCKPSQQNKNGDTALHISSAMGRRKLTNIFLEAGCDKSLKNKACEVDRIKLKVFPKRTVVWGDDPNISPLGIYRGVVYHHDDNTMQFETARDIATRKGHIEILSILDSSKSSKSKKNKQKKSSETSDSDKRSKDHSRKSEHSGEDQGDVPGWSPYGCHYYPDLSLFPQPNLDSLPCEPLSKGEQYFLDLAGNICKGPVGVGLTCHCRNFVLDMESRLERHSAEVRARLRVARAKLEHRVTKTEGMLNEYLGGRHRPARRSEHRHHTHRSRSLDLLSTDEITRRIKHTHIGLDSQRHRNGAKLSDSDEAKSSTKDLKNSDSEIIKTKLTVKAICETSTNGHDDRPAAHSSLSTANSDQPVNSALPDQPEPSPDSNKNKMDNQNVINQNTIQTFSVQV